MTRFDWDALEAQRDTFFRFYRWGAHFSQFSVCASREVIDGCMEFAHGYCPRPPAAELPYTLNPNPKP